MTKELEITVLEGTERVREAWDTYVLGHPNGTLFHLTAWQRVIEKTFPYKPMHCLATRNGRISGILPLYLVRILPFGHALISLPLAVYGGICADDHETAHALLMQAQTLARQARVRFLELRHETPFCDLPVKDLYVTFRRPIFPDEEKNLAAIPRKQRRMVRQGDKHGLSARVGGGEFLNGFYAIYSHSVKNLGTPVYPLQLFAHLLHELGPNGCRILAVFHRSEMVAGVMTFFFRDQVMPYYGGALQSAFAYAANDFMYWKLMCFGAEQGYKVFDFGRSKKGTGSYDFKRHWGFDPKPLSYQYFLVTQKTLPDFSPVNSKFALPIAIWKTLPLSVTQALGPKLIRFFP
jgi:FemAB-related protein (PEP-CTERM system-associated)